MKFLFSEDQGTMATYVMVKEVCLAPAVVVEFHTDNLTETWADPQMHILRRNPLSQKWEELYYDDDSYDGLNNPSITFTTANLGGGCTTYRILVRAHNNPSGGNGGAFFSLYMGYSILGTYPLGGYLLPSPELVGTTRTIETVRVNEGASAAKIYRFERAEGDDHPKYVAEATTGGVGAFSAKMPGTTTSGNSNIFTQWVIGTPTVGTREGPIRVVINDAGDGDSDGDGLGDGLEGTYGLTTCPDSTTVLSNVDCGLIDPADTDADGLSDRDEAIGVHDEFDPLELFRWGADPKHKDVFVEIDRLSRPAGGGDPAEIAAEVLEDELEHARERFEALHFVDNPDGTTGVRLHFDIDHDCATEVGDLDGVPGDNDGITSLCGNYGGATFVNAPEGPPTVSFASTAMHFGRVGIFHWSMADVATGQAEYNCWVSRFESGIPDFSGAELAHELGHNFNLYHAGASETAGTNTNPIYPSIMNYAYAHERSESFENVAFSTGERSSINPAALSETALYSIGADISFLEDPPYEFPVDNGRVDWNRDGLFDSSVQALVVGKPLATDYGGAELPTLVGMENVAGNETSVGVGAAEFEASTPVPTTFYKAIWLVINNATTNTFEYRHRFTEGPYEWGIWYSLGNQVFRADSEPAVTTFTTSQGERLFVFGVEAAASGRLLYAELARDHYTGSPATTWLSLNMPTGVEMASVSVATEGGHLYVVGRDAAPNGVDELWINSMDVSGAWSGWSPIEYAAPAGQLGTRPVKSVSITPGLAAGPDDRLYLFVKSADERQGKLMLYTFHLNPPAPYEDPHLWRVEPTSFWPSDGFDNFCSIAGRPGVVYAEHLDASGQALPGGTGAFWLWYAVTGVGCGEESPFGPGKWNTFFRKSYGYIDSSGPGASFSMGPWQYSPFPKSVVCHNDEAPGSGMALVSGSGGLEAFATHLPGGEGGCATSEESILYIPNADGAADVELYDHNDHACIEAHLASSLSGLSCGGAPSLCGSSGP